MHFWSFDFSKTYIYYRSCIYLKRYKRKMCTAIVLWVKNSWQVWGLPPRKKIPYGDLDFWNFVPKSIGSSVSENFANFWCFQKIRLKGFLLENLPRKPPWASLARSALEPPWASLARSVPKPSPPRTQIFSSTTSTSWKPEAKRWLWVKWVKWSEWSEVTPFWFFIFPETYIYYRSCIYLNRYKRKMCTAIVLWV